MTRSTSSPGSLEDQLDVARSARCRTAVGTWSSRKRTIASRARSSSTAVVRTGSVSSIRHEQLVQVGDGRDRVGRAQVHGVGHADDRRRGGGDRLGGQRTERPAQRGPRLRDRRVDRRPQLVALRRCQRRGPPPERGGQRLGHVGAPGVERVGDRVRGGGDVDHAARDGVVEELEVVADAVLLRALERLGGDPEQGVRVEGAGVQHPAQGVGGERLGGRRGCQEERCEPALPACDLVVGELEVREDRGEAQGVGRHRERELGQAAVDHGVATVRVEPAARLDQRPPRAGPTPRPVPEHRPAPGVSSSRASRGATTGSSRATRGRSSHG